jgi:hypothetical protein
MMFCVTIPDFVVDREGGGSKPLIYDKTEVFVIKKRSSMTVSDSSLRSSSFKCIFLLVVSGMVVGVVHSACRIDLSRLDYGVLQDSRQKLVHGIETHFAELAKGYSLWSLSFFTLVLQHVVGSCSNNARSQEKITLFCLVFHIYFAFIV